MADIPSTSITLFKQSTPPVGWTKITTYDDYALRITSGTVASVTTASAFSSVFTTITPTGSISGSATSGSVTLDATIIPVHTHSAIYNTSTFTPGGYAQANGPINGTLDVLRYPGLPVTPYTTGPVGGGGGHSHTMPMTITSSPGFTGSTLNMNVKYVDMIIAQRN